MRSADHPLVSIITVVWNNVEVTEALLRSIQDHNTYPAVEIIVVDNGSSVDPEAALRSLSTEIQVIHTGKNLGFAGGNNAGIRAAKGDFFFLVNNDTEFTEGLIEGLLEIFEQYPQAGIASPKFHYFFSKGTIEYAGYEAVNIFTGRNGMVGCKQPDLGQFDRVQPTAYAHGGGMMASRKVVDEAGLMPEIFFLYYEEFDWCESIKRKGYQVYYQPKSLIYHKESMTTGKTSPLKTYYQTRNRILFMHRNVSPFNFLVFVTYFTLFTIPKNTLVFFLRGQREHLRSFWKAIFWQFNHSISF